jgi:UDP-2,3-diacylglucosamine hydrolase
MAETLFIADLHLSEERPAVTELFLRFLRERAADAEALYILGDLFDAWIGDDDDSQLANAVRDAIKSVTDRGTWVFVQAGNRDFLIGERFLRETGSEMLDETSVIDLAGQRTLMMHGDLLCTDDTDYQQARIMLRSPAFIAEFSAKSLPERRTLAVEYRRRSGEATSLKAEDIMDVNPHTVADYLRHHEASRLIHGHTHRPGCHSLELDGLEAQRWVLGEWNVDGATILSADNDGLNLERFR